MKGQIFKANGIDIWAESFGNPDHPAFLLIMGGCCQGILWPTEFCAALADQGFYVIRYDHRDAGLSTCFNFDEAPYTHFDMAKDAIGLLDALGIEKAHLFGLSTGGSIGQIIAAHFPSRVLSLGLIATSTDFEPLDRALQGKPPLSEGLSSPSEAYLSAMDQFLHDVPETEEEELEQRVAIWQLLNGSKIPLEENAQRKLHMEFLKRLRWRPGLENHIRANYLSEDVLREAANKIRVPTIVFQGSEDPIFQPDHGEALAGAISGSSYHVLEGHGHVPNPHFFDVIVEKLAWNARRPMPSGSDFYVHSGSIKLWVETFGPPSLPSVLLISGAGASARFWTDDMCERIASGGYYVVRFDHRDTGLSSHVDWEKSPYTVIDLSRDALAILDHLKIQRAHIVGHSMGGTVAQLTAIRHPGRVLSYTSISAATAGEKAHPSEEIMAALMENQPTQNAEESLEGFMRSWRILNGDMPLDQELAREYTKDLYHRSIHEIGVAWNHIRAQENIGDLSRELSQISVPGLFIHGEKDPLIPVEGGVATANAASNASIKIIPKMGHMIFHRGLQEDLADHLLQHFHESRKFYESP